MSDCDVSAMDEYMSQPMSKEDEIKLFWHYREESIKKLLIDAFSQGYESGHNDTVESAYTDSVERAQDWLDDTISDSCGTVFDELFKRIE